MAYIGQGIKQGTFKVLDTSGNTYNGSNTTFSLGTQVGAAAQLLVSHDGVIQLPGTDYTLASGGASITFSTAPASGASIFIVEISGAVGGTVTPSDNSVGVTQLNLSDGTNGQALTTNGSGTISFSTISTSLTGIDDQSSSNDDQVTITDTAVVINEDSDDVDFRVESNGNANMLFVSGGNDVVGIGAEGDLGVGLHIKSADSSATVSGDGDELVIENGSASNMGMTFLSPTNGQAHIMFGDSGDNDIGFIAYNHDDNSMKFKTNAVEKMRITTDGRVGINKTPNGTFFHLTGSSNTDYLMKYTANNNTHQTHYMAAFTNLSDTTIGSITSNNNNAVAYNTSSDYRLKENVNYNFDATTRLKQLKPARFNFISDEDNTLVDGFLAHEVSSIVPEAINGDKDATETRQKVILDSSGNFIAKNIEQTKWTKGKEEGVYPSDSTWEASKVYPVYQGIDQSKLVPLLVKTIQELEARIKALEDA